MANTQIYIKYPTLKPKSRKEYQKKYYQTELKEKRHEEYIRQKYQGKEYLEYTDVKASLKKLSRQIGEVNLKLVNETIENLAKHTGSEIAKNL